VIPAPVKALSILSKNNIRIHALETRYEVIVADLEQAAKRLIDFAGVGWNPSTLKFHESARQCHVHTQNYRGSLNPFIENL
jgi:hypothetical protein